MIKLAKTINFQTITWNANWGVDNATTWAAGPLNTSTYFQRYRKILFETLVYREDKIFKAFKRE